MYIYIYMCIYIYCGQYRSPHARARTCGRRLGMRTGQGALAHPCRRTARGTARLGAPPRDVDQAGRPRASLLPHCAQRGAARGAT